MIPERVEKIVVPFDAEDEKGSVVNEEEFVWAFAAQISKDPIVAKVVNFMMV